MTAGATVERREHAERAEQHYGVDRRGAGARSELRFLVGQAVARHAERLAREHLKLGDVEADSPWYTTTYCDTPDDTIYRAAESGAGPLLRFREYHGRRPERALCSLRIWIEWKDEDRERSRKQRLIVRPAHIAPFLRGEGAPTGRLDLGARGSALFARGPRPVVVSQCRRVAYSSLRDDVRITFDNELTYYAPEETDAPEPTPCPLGPILAAERGILVEVKWQSELPHWVADLLRDLRAETDDRPPKFVVAMRHLLAHRGQTRD